MLLPYPTNTILLSALPPPNPHRNSWDPSLVSPEVRLLDHTISMYNLVTVCTFCAQFFDPDFPDGIAYPVRVDSPVRRNSVVCYTILYVWYKQLYM